LPAAAVASVAVDVAAALAVAASTAAVVSVAAVVAIAVVAAQLWKRSMALALPVFGQWVEILKWAALR